MEPPSPTSFTSLNSLLPSSDSPTSITAAGKSPSFNSLLPSSNSPTSITSAGKSPSFNSLNPPSSTSPTSITAAGKSPSFNSPPTTPTAPRTPTTPSTPTFLFDMTTSENLLKSSQGAHQPSPRIQRSFAHRLGQLAYERERANSIEERAGDISPTAAVLDIGPITVDEEVRVGRGRRELFKPEPRTREVERGEERRDTRTEGLLSTSEDIFVIPPQMSIDEKLFQDEVILWSHYVKLPEALKQPQSIFNFVFFGFFFVTTLALAYLANMYISFRAIFVTIWLMAPIVFFSGFLLAKLLLEHTCYFVTNYRVIQCKLLGARITSKSMSYPSITDVRLGKHAISIYAKRNYHFLKFIGVENVNAVNKILQQQRNNSAQIGPLDSPQSLDTQHIPEKYVHLIQSADLPFLEVNRASSLTSKYLWGTVKFAVAYLWVGGLLFLTRAGPGWMIPYFLCVLLLPIIFLLTNTLDKVDVVGARSLVFLRVGLAYIKQCRYGRNALRLSYDNAYPLISSYNVKNNNGDIAFYNFTFANLASEDVIATEEIIFHKYLDAIYNATA